LMFCERKTTEPERPRPRDDRRRLFFVPGNATPQAIAVRCALGA
jgi:hypothetical protein